MTDIDFKVYLITDRKLAAGGLIPAVEEALKGGVRAVQLREKDLDVRELLAPARQLRELTSRYGARLFINDRVDVALSVGADGVHLGRESLPPDAVRRASGGKLLIGVSTHSAKEAYEASDKGADFIVLGPVFKTPSKLQYGDPVGLEIISDVRADIKIPIFAIGGIRAENIPAVIWHKADGIAVISGILSAENVFNEAQKFMELMK